MTWCVRNTARGFGRGGVYSGVHSHAWSWRARGFRRTLPFKPGILFVLEKLPWVVVSGVEVDEETTENGGKRVRSVIGTLGERGQVYRGKCIERGLVRVGVGERYGARRGAY